MKQFIMIQLQLMDIKIIAKNNDNLIQSIFI